jgi:hypothetical protein
MSTQVTVTLPDDIYQRAAYLARLTGRAIADVLTDTIDLPLQPLSVQHVDERPLAECSDAEVLALAEAQMDPAQDRRLSMLLERQQAGLLTEDERAALRGLLQTYQDGLLRKALALRLRSAAWSAPTAGAVSVSEELRN